MYYFLQGIFSLWRIPYISEKKTMKKIIFITLIGMLTACSAKLIRPTQADVDRVAAKYPAYTLAELNEGKAIYEQQCAACHALQKPASRNEEAWKKIVPVMVTKVNKRAGKEEISPEKQEILLRYLVTMSTAGSAKKN